MFLGRYAQRRPGPKPRLHGTTLGGKIHLYPAQRRPGPKPRLHSRGGCRLGTHPLRSTKAGAKTPATREGGSGRFPCRCSAQRRPGPKPRLHRFQWPASGAPQQTLNEGRGQNPGYTCCERTKRSLWLPAAQRRPGPKPRLHGLPGLRLFCGPVAQRRPGPKPRLHRMALAQERDTWRTLNEGRGQNPGYTTRPSTGSGRRVTLNEGRGQNPGYTGRLL